MRRPFLEGTAGPAGGSEHVELALASVHAQLDRVLVLVAGLAYPDVIEPDLLERADDFRFKQGFSTHAEAVKWLLDAALKAKLAPKEGD